MRIKKNISIKTNRCRVPPKDTKKASSAIDYAEYILNKKELTMYILTGSLFTAMISWLFYDSFIAWLFLLPLVVLSLKEKRAVLCQKRKNRLELEFREVILSVSSNLQAGYSVENAFHEAYQDIVLLYGMDCVMASELRLLFRRLNNNEQLEDLLLDLAKRSGVQDIRDFADIFRIAKRGGGDMRGIIKNTADIISDKREVKREIETVVSEKKFEQTIMRYMPFLIIFYISLTTKGYFESLYHNLLGWVIMTVALIIYAIACRLSDKILDIEI